MNKIISINIGGVIFHIEEDAYQVLSQYLQSVSRYFRNTEGSKEIIADIEGRVAEMLQEKLKGKKEALVMEDIDDVVHRMGRPQEFADAEGEEYREEAEPVTATYHSRGRLFRDPDDKILGGVCSGISARFNLDPVWLRLAFALAVILYGTGFLLYIILWIIIPQAKTPAEKLEMRGEEVTISNIERSFKEEFEGLKKKFGKVSEEGEVQFRHWRKRTSGGLSATGEVVKKLFYILIVLIGLIGLIAVVMFLLSLFGVAAVAFPLVSPLVFIHDWQFVIGIISISLLFLIPVVFLVYTGLRMLLGGTRPARWIGPSLLTFWIIGLLGTLTLTGLVVADFSNFQSVKEEIPVSVEGYETLYVDITQGDKEQLNSTMEAVGLDFLGTLYVQEDHLWISNVRLEVIQSSDSLAHLSIYRSSRGRNPAEAAAYAESIAVDVQQKDSTLYLGALMNMGENKMFRNQKVRIVLSLPEGKKISFSPSTSVIADDFDNWDKDEYFSGNIWQMKRTGLVCLTCGSDPGSFGFKKEFPSDGFENLKVEGNIRVIFQTDSITTVTLAGHEAMVSDIDVRQEGQTLLLRYKGRHWHWTRRRRNVVIYLRTPNLQKLILEDNSEVEFSGNISNNLSVRTEGASRLKLETYSPGARVEIRMEGATKARMTGDIDVLDVRLEGIAHLEATSLVAQEVTIRAEGASHGEVFAQQKLNGKIEGAARLDYKGSPEISTDLEDAGRISKVL